MYAIVIPFDRSIDDIWFYYKIWDLFVKPWMIVKIPFSKTEIYWLVWEITTETNINDKKIKYIKEVLYNWNIFLSKEQIKVLYYISSKYYNLVHNSLSLFIPSNLKNKILKNKFNFSIQDINYSYNNDKILREKQKQIFLDILNSDKKYFLLYWETWTWKTEIYINLIKKNLDLSKQSLLLVPEIILTNQIYDRIKKVFWDEVLVINSSISTSKKSLYWEQIYSWKAKIIVWTRSAIFYPYKNLWIIIVDEEHDNSYISDMQIRYDSIDVLYFYNQLLQSKLVLWSWTPKINHMYERLKWKYEIKYLLK